MAIQTLTQDDLLARLNTIIRDPENKVYTPDEKTEALRQSIDDDPQVFQITRDSSLTVEAAKVSYDLPENLQEVLELQLDFDNSGFGYTLDRGGYEVINGTIWLARSHRALPAKAKLIIVAMQKLYTGDDIPDYFSGYVLHNAAAYLLELLISDKTGRFLKNDTSLGEITAAIQNHRAVAARYARTLPNRNSTRL